MTVIQFEAVVIDNTFRIPDQYTTEVPSSVKVTIMPAAESKIKFSAKSKASMLTANTFSSLKLDKCGYKFNREEANECNGF